MTKQRKTTKKAERGRETERNAFVFCISYPMRLSIRNLTVSKILFWLQSTAIAILHNETIHLVELVGIFEQRPQKLF